MKPKNQDILCPPAFEPTEDQITIAHIKCVFEDYIYGVVHSLEHYMKMKEGNPVAWLSEDKITEFAKRDLENWHESLHKWSDGDDGKPKTEWWESFMSREDFINDYVSGLNSMHSGDCTAFPCTCQRCYAENLFGIPNTATWGSKSTGARLYREWAESISSKDPV